MNQYKPISSKEAIAMTHWRKFAAVTMERFPPAFLMVLFLLSLYTALNARDQLPAIEWVTERFGITVNFWQTLFLFAAGTLAYFRPSPKWTIILSIPAAFLGGFILWYGVVTGRDMTAIVYVFFCWFALGMAMVVAVLYHEQLLANEMLAKKIAELQKEQEHVESTAAPAPQ